MSKRSKEKKPALADWDVVLTFYDGAKVSVPASRWRRDEAGGYTFTDKDGVVADFAPGFVVYVHRVEPAEVPAQKALTEDETRQSGYEAGDPGPIEVGKP